MGGEVKILQVLAGSRGYGMAGSDSDYDYVTVVVETPEQVMGLDSAHGNKFNREQPTGVRTQPGDEDHQVHSLREFCALAAKGNPNALEVFFLEPSFAMEAGLQLQASAPAFWSQRAVERYRGYMKSQTMRILGLQKSGHGRRGSGGREELIAAHGYDTKYAAHVLRLGILGNEWLRTGAMTFPMQAAGTLKRVREGGMPFEWFMESAIDFYEMMGGSALAAPGEPDWDRINGLMIDVHRDVWAGA